MKLYRDKARKFEAVFETLWKPCGNKDNKRFDCVIFFSNSYGY